MEIYKVELENVECFKKFNDVCKSFPLYYNKQEEDENIGEFKGNISIYNLPEDPNVDLPERMFKEFHTLEIQDCLVRVYIIQAYDLQPKDTNGLVNKNFTSTFH